MATPSHSSNKSLKGDKARLQPIAQPASGAQESPQSVKKTKTRKFKTRYGLLDWLRLRERAKDPSGNSGILKLVALSEVSQHSTAEDAWTVIREKVYNITPYLKLHPGGIDELMKGAGIDSTDLFNKVHDWVDVETELRTYYVGPLLPTIHNAKETEECEDDYYLPYKTQSSFSELSRRRAGFKSTAFHKLPRGLSAEPMTHGTTKTLYAMKPFWGVSHSHAILLSSKFVNFWHDKVIDVPGFHPYLPSCEVETVMSAYLSNDGNYLVRPSAALKKSLNLTATGAGKIWNIKIYYTDDDQFSFQPHGFKYPDLQSLLDQHSLTPLQCINIPDVAICLQHPILVDPALEMKHKQMLQDKDEHGAATDSDSATSDSSYTSAISGASSINADGVADNSGEEETEEDFVKRINEAFECGEEIARKLAHAMLIGPPGSGKSSLMDRLLHRIKRKCSTSTNITESIATVEVRLEEKHSTFHAAMVIDGKWEECEFNESLISHMSLKKPLPFVFSPSKIEPLQQELSQPPLELTVSPPSITKSQALSQPTKGPFSQSKPLENFPPMNVVTEKVEAIQLEITVTSIHPKLSESMILFLQRKFGSYKRFKKIWERGFSLYLRDTGGQVEFQEVLPLLIFGPSIFLFVFRLDLPFDKTFEVKYREEDADFNNYTSSITIEEALLQCLATVEVIAREGVANTESRIPFVFIVGTHKDKLCQQLQDCNSSMSLEEELRQRNRNLNALLKQRGFDRLVSSAGNDSEHVMFTVDNTSRDEKDFDLIRSRINAVVSSREEFLIHYPINYLLFCLDLQNVKDSIMLLRDFKERALRFGVKGDVEVSRLLHFLCSRIGVIQHFDEGGIRHIVVNHPQFLYSKVSRLVIETFKGKTLRAGERVDLEKGILSLEAAESIIGATSMIKTRELLALLTNLHIIAPLKSGKYFIPCVINHLPEPCDEDPIPEEVAPLYICFQRKHCPKGLFAVLVTYLLEEVKTISINLQFNLDKVYKDQVSFEVESGEDILDILHLKVVACSYLEITFFPEERDWSLISDVCVTIRCLIEKYLSKSFQALHYNEELVKYEMCLRCDCCSELHKVLSTSSKLRCKRKKLPLPDKGRYWFYDNSTQAGRQAAVQPRSQESPHLVSQPTALPASQQDVKQSEEEILDSQTTKSSTSGFALAKTFGVSEEIVSRQVSDALMMEISRCSCKHWKRLYPYLELEEIDAADVDKLNEGEREKRQAFLALWREKKGSAATYSRLIAALLKTDCREEAEKVCILLKPQLN